MDLRELLGISLPIIQAADGRGTGQRAGNRCFQRWGAGIAALRDAKRGSDAQETDYDCGANK